MFYKAHTGVKSIPYEDTVREALCFGWIDSLVKRLDDDRYALKVTPRQPTSKWSDINRKRWVELKAAGLLTPAGLAAAPTNNSSNRSRFITLSHAATKSRDELLLGVVRCVDLRERAELGMRAEDEVGGRGRPLDLARGAVATLVHVLRRAGRLPLRAHVEQVHEEVVGQRLGPVGEDAVLRLADVGIEGPHAADRAPSSAERSAST